MYNESIFTAIIGLVIIILGAINRTGNISTLHAYHRNRVSEEDRIPFGKMVGTGTIIIGSGIIAMAALSALAIALSTPLFTTVGYGALIVGLVIGISIAFAAMIKYNKGIF